jgi:hypothetical protein
MGQHRRRVKHHIIEIIFIEGCVDGTASSSISGAQASHGPQMISAFNHAKEIVRESDTEIFQWPYRHGPTQIH